MMSVYKYPVEIDDDQMVLMPQDAVILSFAEQRGTFCLWALVNPTSPLTPRRIRIAGTGHPIEIPAANLKFIGTTLLHGGSLVFHAFEVV